ncbi:DUF397 domain-containing protein [Micromonospora sp. NPDC052213]|uniref:DUF397 domain-containing protein n=1 Tax=Micromonospora sp. NPDC052213 TaxID=3155812 RepID=UPI003440A193
MDSQWRKSTRSGGDGACVETRYVDGVAQVRDSKSQQGPVLSFSRDRWMTFVNSLKRRG